MTTQNLIDGLLILKPHYKKPDGYNIGADHDVVYGYPTKKPLPPEDVKKMIDLGWNQEYSDRDYNKDFAVEDYRPDESWHAYV